MALNNLTRIGNSGFGTDTSINTTGTVIYNLSANDYVDIYIGQTHHVNLSFNFFMGYLLG